MPDYTISDEEAERLIPATDFLKLHIEGVAVTRAKYLEQMAAAFILETGVPATHIELVEQDLPWPQIGKKFYYRIRKQ